MSIDKQILQSIVTDQSRLIFDTDIPKEYLSDALGRREGIADALVFPLSTQEVSSLLRCAHENHIPVTPRGGRDENTWQRELHANMDAAYAKAYRLGGIASGEHGIGLSKRRYFLRETAAENLAAMNAIKDALDPLHILNDQKSYIKGGADHAESF